eukprot:TRINITY_DN7267_c0_g1_i7.p1 TRINITY_DN7267_c0_g1~~TRINITY_DN7267_c0_g1_i7.p1  ORF type:complete len:219 (+),score=67.17 TRINITY_DN7267_c0_g1_i7:340-996(+)
MSKNYLSDEMSDPGHSSTHNRTPSSPIARHPSLGSFHVGSDNAHTTMSSYQGGTRLSNMARIPILITPRREPTCGDHLRSVKVLLPTMVGIVVSVMAIVTIVLLVLNTNTAVNDVANLLHNQVLAVVESRILSHLDQVLSINTASAKTVNKRPLGLPPANQTPVNDTWLVEHLDSVVNGYALVDVHYVFFRNGRVVASLANDATTNLYAEEFLSLIHI